MIQVTGKVLSVASNSDLLPKKSLSVFHKEDRHYIKSQHYLQLWFNVREKFKYREQLLFQVKDNLSMVQEVDQ